MVTVAGAAGMAIALEKTFDAVVGVDPSVV
jgi:hypothetical protein